VTGVPEDITGWADRIERAIGAMDGCPVAEAAVYQRVSSTQDAASRHAAGGRQVVVVASEQTRGRGRLGRRWEDGVGATLPMSVAIVTRLSGVQLAARAGLAALDACSDRLPASEVLIKWPNDIVVRSDGCDRKLAGVLIERRGGVAVIGVGINTRSMPACGGLCPIAFEDLGVVADRCDLAIGVLGRLGEWLCASDGAVRARWSESDAMVGTERAFDSGGGRIRGEVLGIDPLSSIRVRTDEGDRRIAVATARTAG